MDGNSLAASVARLVATRGETVILRRDTATDVSVRASIRECNTTDLVGDIRQGDRRVVISNAEIAAAGWPGPPSKDRKDRIIIDGKVFTITDCDTRKVADVIAGHWIIIRG